jgi:hypothetical protein
MRKKTKSVREFVGACCLLGLVAGCGPIYDTRYHFVPPSDPSARSCIFQCENLKMQCEELEQMRVENCDYRARLDQDRCRAEIRRQGREPKSHECSSLGGSCYANTERCEAKYRQCYQNCGGQVRTEQVCVFNCP